MLAGVSWQTALILLDSPHLDQPQIETMLAAQARGSEPELPTQSNETHAPPPAPTAPHDDQAPNKAADPHLWAP